jgi:class 3 adenylate cyclase/predicted ATPase
MFCDMEGFTQFSEKLGPEEAYGIMDKIYELLIYKVHDYEGIVNEMTGDGIMALFGAPIALEDAPQRAIRSAMAIHREIAKFSDEIKKEKAGIPALKMRVGIHSGPVVVGTLGNNLRVEFKAVGDTVNLASRMEGLAEPGATYVTENTFKLTEGIFQFEALGEKKFKGKKEPIKVYRVIAPSTGRTRFDVNAERGLTPFVGRERELELLLDGFERSKSGRGQSFSIVSEAGLGKTRLLFEFRKAVFGEDMMFLEGRCLSYSRGVAYHPVIDILKANFDIRESDRDLEIKEKVKKGLKILRADEASTLPYFLELFSVKESGIDKIPLSPEARKDRIIEAVKRITIKGSEIRPLVLAFEDLHWVDKSSEDVLKYLLESIPGARVLMIFTFRPEFVHTWGGKSYHSQLNLNRLSNRESLAMVSYLLGKEEIDRGLEELILEKTEGVPFFIEEFIRSLQDLKVIELKDNRYRIAKDIKEATIPATVQDVIMARVDSLPEGTKELLQTVSAVGSEFSYNLAKRLTGFTEQKLLSQLSVLKDSELLYERGIYPQSTYIFKNVLTQEVTYQSLLQSTRQKYHRKIAQVLGKNFPDTLETQPEHLAHHFTEAGLNEQAVGYWHQAGERATRRSAHAEAISHLTKALELLKTLPDTPERSQRECMLQLALGLPLTATKGYGAPDVEHTYTRARELCQQAGVQSFRALFGLWRFYLLRAKYGIAREIGEQLHTQARSAKDPMLLVAAHRALGATLFYLGEMALALEHFEQGMALYDPQHHHSYVSLDVVDPAVACQSYAAWALWWIGYPDQALEKSHEALTPAQELAHPFSLALALSFAAWLHQFRRERQAAQERAEATLTISTEQSFPLWLGWGMTVRGWALVEQGQGQEGIAQIRQGLTSWRSTGSELGLPYFLALLAEAYGKVGQAEEGFKVLAEALVVVNKSEERWYEAELHRLKGELLRQNGQTEAEVEACFHQAVDMARRQSAKSLELRAVMSLSRLWQGQGKRKEARRMIQEIYGWFSEGFDTADLKEAKILLEELA